MANTIYILSGAVRTGKTTSLINWLEEIDDAYGILTPIVNGKRVFFDASSKETFPMEASVDEVSVAVGRYKFSLGAFQKASVIIDDHIGKPGVMIIDEIGPLELRGEGFCKSLKKFLEKQKEDQILLLVVRESILEDVIAFFQLDKKNISVIMSITEIHYK
jgi:nucleoside-triphosphatase